MTGTRPRVAEPDSGGIYRVFLARPKIIVQGHGVNPPPGPFGGPGLRPARAGQRHTLRMVVLPI